MNDVLILGSGGIDSTACIKYYLDLNFKVSALFIDYQQKSNHKEFEASKKICQYYNVKQNAISVYNHVLFSNGLIIGRNALLLNIALMNIDFDSGLISLGIHYRH